MGSAERELWTAVFRREQLLDLLDGRGPVPRVDSELSALGSEREGELLGIWSCEDPGILSPLPQIIASEEKCLDDLFAWCSSYLRGLGPLSGVVRTLSLNQLSQALKCHRPKEQWEVAGGAVGVVMAEGWCREGWGIGVEDGGVVTASSTLSHAMFRGWVLGYSGEAMDQISEEYLRLGEELGGSGRDEIGRSVVEVVSTVLGLRGGGVDKLQRAKDHTRQWWEALRLGSSVYEVMAEVVQFPDDLFKRSDLGRMRDMTAEERVQVFDLVAPALLARDGRSERTEAAFALALGAFTCRPGFLQQASLLQDYAKKLPEAALWLGALQMLSPLSESLLLQSGLGWRIAREVYRSGDLFSAPRAEASGAEIRKLLGAKSRSYRELFQESRVEIEIYPMIVGAFGGGGRQRERDGVEGRGHRDDERHENRVYSQKLRVLERQLREALRTLSDAKYGGDRVDTRRVRGGRR